MCFIFPMFSWEYPSRGTFGGGKKNIGRRVLIGLACISLPTSVFVFWVQLTPSRPVISVPLKDYQGLLWVRNHTPKKSILLSDLDWGVYVSAMAQRRVVLGALDIAAVSTGLAKEVKSRARDVRLAYRTKDISLLEKIIEKYGIKYVVERTNVAGGRLNANVTGSRLKKIFRKGAFNLYEWNKKL